MPAKGSARVPVKWRPPLSVVVGGILGLVILLPPAVVLLLRLHETEALRGADTGQILAWALVAAAGLAAVAGVVIHRAVTRPVHALIRRTRDIAGGDRMALRPLDQHGTAEFAELSQSLLDMADGLARRSDVIGSFAAHVSHELKSPLTSMRASAELLRDALAEGEPALTEPERLRLLTTIVDEASRLGRLLDRLRDLARAEGSPVGGQAALKAVLPDLQSAHPAVRIVADGPVDRPLPMAEETLKAVLGHLVDNAARHGATVVTLEPSLEIGEVILRVRDDGSGIAHGNRERIFDAFFTTRRREGGTGMGLAIVRALVEAHGGTVALDEAVAGAHFVVRLPALQPASSKI